jgi:hypothetical protein
MASYIREAGVERDGEEIPLEVHFRADIDDDRIIVDNLSLYAYRLDEGNKRFMHLTPNEQDRIAQGLEKLERSSVIAEARRDFMEYLAEGRFDNA